MEKIRASLERCQADIEAVIKILEKEGRLGEALAAYQEIEGRIEKLDLLPGRPHFADKQRVLTTCLMGQEGILRKLGRMREARSISEREMAAARQSSDRITMARALLSSGMTMLLSGEAEHGVSSMENARRLFESEKTAEYQRGLGWYWAAQADLLNAGALAGKPADAIQAADRALEILLPLEDQSGVTRAYAARAKAGTKLGGLSTGSSDRETE